MKKAIQHACIILVALIYSHKLSAQQAIAQPYYGEAKIRIYNKTNPVAGSPCYTLDLSADANAQWGVTQGINDVIIYQDKLFVSFDAGNNTGGVLIYNYADVYPTKTVGPAAVIKPQTTAGLACAGIAIQPSTGNLFIGTFYNGSSDAGIYEYTASSSYTSGIQFASYYNDASVDAYVANLAFDPSGNFWFTEFDGNNNAAGNYLICYEGCNKDNYYKIVNTANKAYTAAPLTGGAGVNVYLLSQPEGIAFDASGNLWLGNNNDDYNCNDAGQGTLVKINANWITGTLFNLPYMSTDSVPTSQATVDYIPGSKLGGMLFDGSNLYINDQGQNQGSDYTASGTVWKWDVTTTFNSTNFAASGIHTTYPGNGLMALTDAQFSLASDCVPTGIRDLTADAISLSIYPNPAANSLMVANTLPGMPLIITDALGRQIMITKATGTQQSMDITHLAAGIYFLNHTKFVKE
jgi:Secretion system C-terminal sorting domain